MKLFFPYVLLLGVITLVVIANVPRGPGDSEIQVNAICGPCGMEVEPSTAISTEVDGETFYFCSSGCRRGFFRSGAENTRHATSTNNDGRLVDVVCHMEVNRAWGIKSVYNQTTYHFCADRCRDRFERDPARYLTEMCLVCGSNVDGKDGVIATYLGNTYRLCNEAHRAEFKRDPAAFFMHSMWGIPTWLYYASIALVMVVSFGLFEWMGRAKSPARTLARSLQSGSRIVGSEQIKGEGERMQHSMGSLVGTSHALTANIPLPILSLGGARAIPYAASSTGTQTGDRFDLFSVALIKKALHSRLFRFVLQAVFVLLFLAIIAAGLLGNQNPALNIAPILTWTIWWGALIILIMFAGKAWCYVCPWDAIAGWTEKLSFWKKNPEGLSLGLKWPRVIRNVLMATILFVGLTWIELGFGVTMKPRVTAYLAISMLLMAVVAALLFDRKSFCRYGCLVGRVSGLYALFSSVEVRARRSDVCRDCATKECVKGSETAYGCPTFLYPGKLQTNTYCIQCMECVQACPHDNLTVNLRPWGSDLAVEGKPRADEAYLALLMLAITGFHGLTMTPVWAQFVDAIRSATGAGRIIGFSVGMTVLMLGPILIYAILVAVSHRLARGRADGSMGYRDYFIQYAYALLPIALFYHIAHNLEHLLMEGPKVVAMVSDPLGWGWNLFGTARWNIPPLISLPTLWLVQVLLVLVGHVYSLWVAQKTSTRLFGGGRAAFRSQLPMLVGMIAFSVFSLWLLKQPMEMRTSAM